MRPQPGQLKTAEREMNPIAVGEDALGVDLQASDVDSRANGAQTGGPLAGRRPARAVTHIHGQGPVLMEERVAQVRVMNNPPVAPPQPVNPRRSACHGADGPIPTPRWCADIMGAQIPRPSVGVAAIPMWGRGFVHRGCGSAGSAFEASLAVVWMWYYPLVDSDRRLRCRTVTSQPGLNGSPPIRH